MKERVETRERANKKVILQETEREYERERETRETKKNYIFFCLYLANGKKKKFHILYYDRKQKDLRYKGYINEKVDIMATENYL